jgi:hypothetical protein
MIAEPMTVLTDFLLAAVCGTLAVALNRAHGGQQVRGWWSAGFCMLAIAALLGGIWHGFAPYLSWPLNAALWKATVYAIGLFNLSMLAGSIVAVTTARLRATLITVAALKFFVFAFWMATQDGFEFVVADSAGAMIGLALLHGWSAATRGDRGSLWVLSAVAVSVIAAGVQYSKLTLHVHFNHNDLYHLIQIAAMLLFYFGGRMLHDQ